MGGGGGSSRFGWSCPEAAKQVQQAESGLANAEFQTELATYLAELLSRFNDRDTRLVRERLDEVAQVLRQVLEEEIDQVFGGSVAKHTYVDGLSDVDCLMILNGTDLHKGGPLAALKTVVDTLSDQIDGAKISSGKLAVTVAYDDGMEI